MSTDLGILKQSNGKEILITRFYGGESDGVCVQLTKMGSGRYIQLSGSDLITLIPILQEYIIFLDTVERSEFIKIDETEA